MTKKDTYQLANQELWKGRSSAPEADGEYWHECVQFENLNTLNPVFDSQKHTFGLLGYACDEGVIRNFGRAGAHEAPDLIRQELGKLAVHYAPKTVIDFGNVLCPEGNLEAAQHEFMQQSAKMVQHNLIPIGIGGGHDLAFAHYSGIKKGKEQQKKAIIGVLNFDAHFDLRAPLPKAHSGSPFFQLLEADPQLNYYVVGLQPHANPQSLFSYAEKRNVGFTLSNQCNLFNINFIAEKISAFFSDCDGLYVSVDLDGFSSAYAPGVSAPSPLGFSPTFYQLLFEKIVAQQRICGLDVVEYNPHYDQDNKTAKLAAQLINFAICTISP
ncbi:MAG: formimidoylglutamase [Flavobacteriaceae bacterium]